VLYGQIGLPVAKSYVIASDLVSFVRPNANISLSLTGVPVKDISARALAFDISYHCPSPSSDL